MLLQGIPKIATKTTRHQMRATDKRVFATIGRNQTCHCLDPELLNPKIVREKITFLLLIHTQAVTLASGRLSH